MSRIAPPILWNDAVASAQTRPGSSLGHACQPLSGFGASRRPWRVTDSRAIQADPPRQLARARADPPGEGGLRAGHPLIPDASPPQVRRLRRERAQQSYRRVQGRCRRAEYCRAALVTSERTTSTADWPKTVVCPRHPTQGIRNATHDDPDRSPTPQALVEPSSASHECTVDRSLSNGLVVIRPKTAMVDSIFKNFSFARDPLYLWTRVKKPGKALPGSARSCRDQRGRAGINGDRRRNGYRQPPPEQICTRSATSYGACG